MIESCDRQTYRKLNVINWENVVSFSENQNKRKISEKKIQNLNQLNLIQFLKEGTKYQLIFEGTFLIGIRIFQQEKLEN